MDKAYLLAILVGLVSLILPWLREEAKKTTTPIDDWMINAIEAIITKSKA